MPQPATSAQVSNSAFLRSLAQAAPNGSHLWVTSFAGSPDLTDAGNWAGGPYSPATQAERVDGWGALNSYFCPSALWVTAEGSVKRRKSNFRRLLALVADDADTDAVLGTPSWVLETSPGKRQVGFFIDRDCEDAGNSGLCERVINEMAQRGLVRVDSAGNNIVRYVRLPLGSNLKPRESGPWACQLTTWNPQASYTLADAAASFGVDLDPLRSDPSPASAGASIPSSGPQDERLRVLTANLLRGESLHDSTNQIAASLVASGLAGGAIVNLLRALLEASLASKDERWAARYADIPRAVSTAVEKFARPQEVVAPTPPGVAEPSAAPSLPVLTLDQLRQQAKSVTWLVKHTIPADSIGIFYGASQTFKSFVAIDLALHVAHGLNWLGKKTKRGTVLFIAAEGGSGLWRRIVAWHRARRLSWVGAPIYVLPVPIDLMTDSGRLTEAVAALGIKPDLVVVDTMSQTFGGEENSATEVAKYLRELGLWFRSAWLACVLVVHHTGHIATERPRGSSAIRNNVDFMFGVFRDEKEMRATFENSKQKDGELAAEMSFSLQVVELAHDEDGDPITSLVASGMTEQGDVLSLMKHEAERGRGGKNQLFLELAMNGVEEKNLRTSFYMAIDGDADAKRQAYFRARKWALNAGLIEIAQGYVIRLGA